MKKMQNEKKSLEFDDLNW